MFIYHYHAMRQRSDLSVDHHDGIIQVRKPILGDCEQWHDVRRYIGGGSDEGLTVCSLTLLSAPPTAEDMKEIGD